MALINLGVSFEEAEAEQKLQDEVLAEGSYQVSILAIEEKTSAANNQYLSVEMGVSLPGSPLDGKRLWDNVTYQAKGRIFFVRFLKGFGVGGWAETSFETDELIGLSTTVNITIEQYDGRDINRVSYS